MAPRHEIEELRAQLYATTKCISCGSEFMGEGRCQECEELREDATASDFAALDLKIEMLTKERDAAWQHVVEIQQATAGFGRMKNQTEELALVVRDLLGSADCEWENADQGHDWTVAVESARRAIRAGDSTASGGGTKTSGSES